MPKTREELNEELCKYCPCTEFGHKEVNTGYWNLCEGYACDEAYKSYLENHEEEEEECQN